MQRKCQALDLYIGTDLGCVFRGHDPILVIILYVTYSCLMVRIERQRNQVCSDL